MSHDRTAVLAASVAALDCDRFDLAMALCAPALARQPNDPHLQLIHGLAAGASGLTEVAVAMLALAARHRGAAAHPVRDLLAILTRTSQTDRIAAVCEAALRATPADAGLRRDLGEYFHDTGRFAEAVALLADSLRLAPGDLAARNLRALVYAAEGRTDAAMRDLRDVLRRDPSQPRVWANLGLLLKDDGHFEEAIAAYDTALSLAPEDAQIRVNRVVALLRAGRWTEAWRDYEWRLRLAEHAARRPRLLPMLSALPDLTGRTVLAVHEDGFGDTLHFARYLPLLADRGARVLAAVPAAMGRPIAAVEGVAEVHDFDRPWPGHDFYCPFFSLPRAFETTPETIPAPIPYLRAEPAAVARWRQRLPRAPLRVGLVWAGQARPTLPGFGVLDGRRSLKLAALAPLARVPNVLFVSLQHGREASQARTPPAGMALFDPMDGVTDFAETAAIVANLDLVVGVDTSVVHLAGGLGKPVFLLDRYDHCWRWLNGRTDSPWYPAMRIFRQARIGAWAPVLEDAAAAVADFAAAARAGREGRGPPAVARYVPERVTETR